jgi:tellurite resistance protein TerC
VSLAIIGGILSVGIIASLISAKDNDELLSPLIDELEKLAITSYKQARSAIILILGSSVLVLGVALIVLPGPAIVVIPLGLSILAVEFGWARRWLRQIKKKIENKLSEWDSQ